MIAAVDWTWGVRSTGCPPWRLRAGFMLLLLVAGLLARTDRPGVRVLAGALKATGIAVLALCLLEPLFSGTCARPGANLFVVLADNSQSMTLKDRGESQTAASNCNRCWPTKPRGPRGWRRTSTSAATRSILSFERRLTIAVCRSTELSPRWAPRSIGWPGAIRVGRWRESCCLPTATRPTPSASSASWRKGKEPKWRCRRSTPCSSAGKKRRTTSAYRASRRRRRASKTCRSLSPRRSSPAVTRRQRWLSCSTRRESRSTNSACKCLNRTSRWRFASS